MLRGQQYLKSVPIIVDISAVDNWYEKVMDLRDCWYNTIPNLPESSGEGDLL